MTDSGLKKHCRECIERKKDWKLICKKLNNFKSRLEKKSLKLVSTTKMSYTNRKKMSMHHDENYKEILEVSVYHTLFVCFVSMVY